HRRPAPARSRSAPRRSARPASPAPSRRGPSPPPSPRTTPPAPAARRRPRAAPRASARGGRADWRRLGGAELPRGGPFVRDAAFLRPRNADRSKRCRLTDRNLVRAAQLEQRQESDGLFLPREPFHLLVEVEDGPALQQRAEPLEKLRDGREVQRHVRQRYLRRRDGKE